MADTTFDIVIRYTGDSRYQPLFDAAAARWEQIIIADLPDIASSSFGFVDDLLIDASVVAIDGSGGVLGQAGPDWIRSASGLPFHGIMEFDSADVSTMFNNGTLDDVILHEMGHILGIGTLWDFHDLITGFQYIGPNALAQYRIISGNASATFVPVENSGGQGTAGGHWEEDIFNAELMTGFIESAGVTMAISRITVGSLADMGYTVNMAAADPFSLPGGPPPSQQPPPTTPSNGPANNDFDGDGDSDIVWRSTDGSVRTWEMQDGSFAASHNLPSASGAWQIDGTGDFDADGDSDILWRNSSNSMVVTWEMENGAFVTNHNIAYAGAAWRIEGYGDFDGDDDADIMWRNSASGLVVTWEMENGNLVTNHNIAPVSNGWRIDGFGDFDGDGDSDVLWRNTGSGAVVTWEMEDGRFVTNHTIEFASLSWDIVATGDFDRDGDSDFVWRNSGSGAVVTWEMEDGRFVGNHGVGTLATAWQVQTSGDFDADGDGDILWRNGTTGAVVTWEIEDHVHTASVNVGTMASAWTLIG
jgi:hypothetical protein